MVVPKRSQFCAQSRERSSISPIVSTRTFSSHCDEFILLQYRQMLGYGGPRYLELGCNLARGPLLSPHQCQYLATRTVGESMQHGIHGITLGSASVRVNLHKESSDGIARILISAPGVPMNKWIGTGALAPCACGSTPTFISRQFES
jgi:hypothetical protein